MAPIYLIKKQFDVFAVLSSSHSDNSRDATHWGLVVNGIQYHITARFQYCPVELDPHIIPEDKLLPWTSTHDKYKQVGETTLSDDEIRSRAEAVTKIMGGYDLLINNCQVFANMLYLEICSEKPDFDLLGNTVAIRDIAGRGFRNAEKTVTALADRMHVPPELRMWGPALDKMAKRFGA